MAKLPLPVDTRMPHVTALPPLVAAETDIMPIAASIVQPAVIAPSPLGRTIATYVGEAPKEAEPVPDFVPYVPVPAPRTIAAIPVEKSRKEVPVPVPVVAAAPVADLVVAAAPPAQRTPRTAYVAPAPVTAAVAPAAPAPAPHRLRHQRQATEVAIPIAKPETKAPEIRSLPSAPAARTPVAVIPVATRRPAVLAVPISSIDAATRRHVAVSQPPVSDQRADPIRLSKQSLPVGTTMTSDADAFVAQLAQAAIAGWEITTKVTGSIRRPSLQVIASRDGNQDIVSAVVAVGTGSPTTTWRALAASVLRHAQ